MKMKAYSSEKGLLVKLDGEIDHHGAAEVREGLDHMIGELRPKTLVLDLKDIDFMDSSGLGLVLGRYRRLQELGSGMLIQDPSARVEKILAMAGVDRLIKIVHTDTARSQENGIQKDRDKMKGDNKHDSNGTENTY